MGDAAKDTPDLGVCTNVADVGVNLVADASFPNALPTGDGGCARGVGRAAKPGVRPAVEPPKGVAVRVLANRSNVCKIRFAVSVVTALVTVFAVGV